MNTNKTQLLMVASIASVMVLAGASSQQAFAHGGQVFGFNLSGDPNDPPNRWITVIMGHNNEPTSAQETGKASGNHPMELFIRDTRTGLNLEDADLTVDKFYYKNAKEYNKAVKKGFVPKETDVPVTGVHGDPGHYFARQILAQPGIYGYHVTGTVNYFGVMDVPIDVKAICRDAPDPSAFNNPSWFGGFGCTGDIDDGKFPAINKKVNHDDDDDD